MILPKLAATMDRFRLKRELIVLELSKGVILLTAELIAELCVSELHQSSNCWKLVQELYFSCFKELSKRMILSSLIKFFICEYFFHRRCHRSLKLGRPVQLKIRTIVFLRALETIQIIAEVLNLKIFFRQRCHPSLLLRWANSRNEFLFLFFFF